MRQRIEVAAHNDGQCIWAELLVSVGAVLLASRRPLIPFLRTSHLSHQLAKFVQQKYSLTELHVRVFRVPVDVHIYDNQLLWCITFSEMHLDRT